MKFIDIGQVKLLSNFMLLGQLKCDESCGLSIVYYFFFGVQRDRLVFLMYLV